MELLNLEKEEVSTSRYIEITKEKDFPSNYVVLDFETTGFDPVNNTIIQMAAFRFRNHSKVAEFMSYVYTTEVPERITEITSITLEDCLYAPKLKALLPELLDFIGNDVIVAHNATFDLSFLSEKMRRFRLTGKTFAYIDTLKLARKNMKGVANYKLSTLKKFLGITVESHLAEADCFVCHEVYKYCLGINCSKVEEESCDNQITREIVDLSSENFDREVERGLNLEKEGNLDKAIEVYESCIKERCNNVTPYDRLIILYRKQKEKESEIRVLELAVLLFPNIDKYELKLRKLK